MQVNLLSLFPNYFTAPLAESILKRAVSSGVLQIKNINLRDFAHDAHSTTDDRPFGGGPGMVMMIAPIAEALESLGLKKGQPNKLIVLTSAKGEIFNQTLAKTWSVLEELTIICGHYEGVDERVALNLVDAEIRIGDYVLTGGEPASLVMLDAVTRLLPGVLGNELSNLDESHQIPGQLGFPQYTRPEVYQGLYIPDVLKSGNHAKIQTWRNLQKR